MQKANMAYVSHRSKYRYSGRSLNTVILEHNVVGVFWPKKKQTKHTLNKKNTKKPKMYRKRQKQWRGLAKPSVVFIASILEVTLDPPPPPPHPRETMYTRFLLQQQFI